MGSRQLASNEAGAGCVGLAINSLVGTSREPAKRIASLGLSSGRSKDLSSGRSNSPTVPLLAGVCSTLGAIRAGEIAPPCESGGSMSRRLRIASILRARAEFGAVAVRALRRMHDEILMHTGEDDDYRMSDEFFGELGKPNTRDQSRAVVRRDPTSTLAGVPVAKQRLLPQAHIEAWLRSYDRTMPNEINRVFPNLLFDLDSTTLHPARQPPLFGDGNATTKILHALSDSQPFNTRPPQQLLRPARQL